MFEYSKCASTELQSILSLRFKMSLIIQVRSDNLLLHSPWCLCEVEFQRVKLRNTRSVFHKFLVMCAALPFLCLVIEGYKTGIFFTVGATQLKYIIQRPVVGDNFFQQMGAFFRELPHASQISVAYSICTVVIILAVNKWVEKKLPGTNVLRYVRSSVRFHSRTVSWVLELVVAKY